MRFILISGRRVAAVMAAVAPAALLGACGDDDQPDARPDVVVTTTILGDVVARVVGDAADVDVIMPRGADPHEFAASARQAEAIEAADLLVVNGGGFEEGLTDVIDAAGAPTFAFVDDDADDPHFWTDPTLVAAGVERLADRLADIDGIDAAVVDERAAAYVAALDELDGDIEALLSAVPEDRRVLVTNHDVLGAFADRYGFEVVGTVIPSSTTNAETSAADLEALADVIEREGVPAIFGETTQSTELADALADLVGDDVEVVELYTESLGEDGSGADTYLGMMRVDAERIAEALSNAPPAPG